MGKVIFEFKNKKSRQDFLAWFIDGGGEYELLFRQETFDKYTLDYTKAFQAWGYNPKVDGDPVISMVKKEAQFL